LGYDGVDDGAWDFAYYENRIWYKDFLRDKLEFRRMILRGIPGISDEEMEHAIHDMDKILSARNTGKGCDESDYKGLKYDYEVKKYFQKKELDDNYSLYCLQGSDFSSIERISVMGHSLMTDREFIYRILEKCLNVKRVVIFTYKDENTDELDSKIRFFNDYFANNREHIPDIDKVLYE